MYLFLPAECNNQNFGDEKSGLATGSSLSPAHVQGAPLWLVSSAACTSDQLVSHEVSAEYWLLPGNNVGDETDSPCPPKAYDRARKRRPPEGM